MHNLSIGQKINVNGVDGFVSEFPATYNQYGEMVEYESGGFDCVKKDDVIKASYTNKDNDYETVVMLSNGEFVLIDGVKYRVYFKGQCMDFAALVKQ